MRDPMRLRSPFILRARFNPASLFGSGETGFVLDLDADALSTRTPGTGVQTITTAIKGVTFSQATTTRQPTYQLDGARPYLQFDGVDDWMSLASLDMGGSDAVTVIAGMRRGQNVNAEEVFGITTTPTAANGSFVLAATSDAASDSVGFASKGDGTNALARAGSSRFFNGRLYALIVINRVLTAGELAGAEAWAASKCGITL